MNETPNLAGPSVRAVPEGDDRTRLLCPDCGYVVYENPKIVVGSVALWEDRILLCRRAIEPRKGFWTLPAGYLELNEDGRAGGAARGLGGGAGAAGAGGAAGHLQHPPHQPDPAHLPRPAGDAGHRGRAGIRRSGAVRVGRDPLDRHRLPVRPLVSQSPPRNRQRAARAAGHESGNRYARAIAAESGSLAPLPSWEREGPDAKHWEGEGARRESCARRCRATPHPDRVAIRPLPQGQRWNGPAFDGQVRYRSRER